MTDHRVAKRYAEALFNVAQRNDVVKNVDADLLAIANQLKNDPSFRSFLYSPKVSREDKTRILEKLFSDRVTIATMYLLRLLLAKRRESEIEAIQEEFEALRRGYAKAVLVTYTSAQELPDAQRKKLVDKTTKVTGRSVEALFEVDPSLIGGVKIEYEDVMLDGTVRGNLDKLRGRLQYDLFKNA